MFVTHRIDPVALVSEFLKGDEHDEEATSAFAGLAHNEDLCPRFRQNVGRVLFAYEKHRTDVHDIQSFKDLGRDVVIDFRDEDGARRSAALQIKSHKEFEDWWGRKTKPDFIGLLRNQYTQAVEEGGAEVWYLVLCVDAARFRDAVRHVVASFSSYSKARIVLPQQALSALRASEIDIDSWTARRLCADDLVLTTAQAALEKYDRPVAELVIDLVCRGLGGERHLTEEQVIEVLNAGSDFDQAPDQLAILDSLNERILFEAETGYDIDANAIPAICALYYDQRVRMDASPWTMPERIKRLLLAG